jgi:hypothetical protein
MEPAIEEKNDGVPQPSAAEAQAETNAKIEAKKVI